MILWHHVVSWVVVLVLIQAICGMWAFSAVLRWSIPTEPLPGWKQEWLLDPNDTLCQLGTEQWSDNADFSLWSTKLCYDYLENWCFLHFSSTVFCGDFSCIFVVDGLFCWFWRGLVLTTLLCIYPYWLAPVYFRPFLQLLKIIPTALIAFFVIIFFFYLIN